MGRKRKKENQWMPEHVCIKKNRYVYTQYLGTENGKIKFAREIVLGKVDKLSKADVWKNYEEALGVETNITVKLLLDKYLKSEQFSLLATRTQNDYQRYYNIITEKQLKNGVFGRVLAEKVKPSSIRKYLDKRACENAPIAANKEIGFLSSAFSWGFERDFVTRNPCIGVRRNKRNRRQYYVNDDDYQYALSLATPAYLPLLMELAYLCRLRKSEVLMLTIAAIKENGLDVERIKGSKGSLILWTDRLRTAVDAAKQLPVKIKYNHAEALPLLHDQYGAPITINAVDSAWKRLMKKIKNTGGNPFWIHDLKRKAVSDFKGDKQKASGHRDPKMLIIYDVLPDEIAATR